MVLRKYLIIFPKILIDIHMSRKFLGIEIQRDQKTEKLHYENTRILQYEVIKVSEYSYFKFLTIM